MTPCAGRVATRPRSGCGADVATNWDLFPQLYYSGGWQGITGDPGAGGTPYVDGTTPVTSTRGVREDGDLQAAKGRWRIHDPSDMYRASNAASPLYDLVKLYTRGAIATTGAVNMAGEISSLAPGETPDHRAVAGLTVAGNRWVDVELGGLLARIGRWRDPLASPMFTQITRYATLRGYWPMEDGRDAQRLTNYAARGAPGQFTGVTLGGGDPMAGSAPLAEVSSTGRATGSFRPMSTTAWQIQFSAWYDAPAASESTAFSWRTSNGYQWEWRISTTTYGLEVRDAGGAVLIDQAYTGEPHQQWVTTRIKVSTSGGTVTVEPGWYQEGDSVFIGVTTGFSGTAGGPTTWEIPPTAATNGSRFGHLFAVTGIGDNLQTYAMVQAVNGFAGETTAERFARLMSSRGLAYEVRGTLSTAVEMGPQPIATFQDQLKEIRETEDGLIFDKRTDPGVVLALRDWRYEQATTPALSLAYPSQIAGPMQEITDARDVFNDVTVKNTGGGSARAELLTGPYAVADPPAGAGRTDKTINVNVYDEQVLPEFAAWWLARLSTSSATRYDTITIDFDANPELITAVNALDPGQVLEVTGRTPDPLLLQVLEISRTTTRSRARVVLSVDDATAFAVAHWSTPPAKYDSATTTLGPARTSTATSWPIETTDRGDCWWTGATVGTPYPWLVAGERLNVTGMTAPVLSGGVWTQTATVVRSVNGVTKAQAAGAPIHVATPGRYAL